jgi:hypothetical protein
VTERTVKSKPGDDDEGEILSSEYQNYNTTHLFIYRRHKDGGGQRPGEEEAVQGSNAFVSQFGNINALTSMQLLSKLDRRAQPGNQHRRN